MIVSNPYTQCMKFGPAQKQAEIGWIIDITPDTPFMLDCGASIATLSIAYQMYGSLNADASNAVLIQHGLTGDQYAAGYHPVTGKLGWWDGLIGSGCVLDTDKYCIIATNVIGGCMGSTGPRSLNHATGVMYGPEFPVLTIADMVRAQTLFSDAMGVHQWLAVIGGSMGGMLTLEWVARYARRVHAAMAIATAARHPPQNIAFHEVGRQAIMADAEFHAGTYAAQGCFPSKGLAVARMGAHITYLSEAALQQKFGRRLQNKTSISYGFDADFQVESYLRYQGLSFVDRFDPNAYLTVTRAVDYFDLEADADGHLAGLFVDCATRMCVVSFSSDWLFPSHESRRLVKAMAAAGMAVSFTEIDTDKGHDAFLLDEPLFFAAMEGFIADAVRTRGLR